MKSPGVLRVRNLYKYQHYKRRNPPWVKLYRETLTDHTIRQLTPSQRCLFLACVLLASESEDGTIPDDPRYLSHRVGMRVRASMISALAARGFLERAELLSDPVSVSVSVSVSDSVSDSVSVSVSEIEHLNNHASKKRRGTEKKQNVPTVLKPLSDHAEVALRSLSDHSETTLRSLSDHPETTLRSLSDHPETTLRPGSPAASGPVWEAYVESYRATYGVPPTRNAKVNAQLKRLVARLGAADAAAVAGWYPSHRAQLYVHAGHCTDLLLRDAEKLRTEWARGRTITTTQARQIDQHEAMGGVLQEAKRILRAKYGQEGHDEDESQADGADGI